MKEEDIGNLEYLKKPLFAWVKSLNSDGEAKKDAKADAFSKFLETNALNAALQFTGISLNEDEPDNLSSLHLSSFFDETGFNCRNIGKFGISSNSQLYKQFQQLYKNFLEIQEYFQDFLNQLLILRPPNFLHIANSCRNCGIEECEKMLTLILKGGIDGAKGQETMRGIKALPTSTQQQLIQIIKTLEESSEVFKVTSWNEFSNSNAFDQQKTYEEMLRNTRKLIRERNEAIEGRLKMEFAYGLLNCDQIREFESRNGQETFDFENRPSPAIRQLKDELCEKSDLLKECREELERTKSELQNLQSELTENQQQLKSLKKTQDAIDVLRESHEKALRLEVELSKMKKKLDDSEVYFDQVEVLQNENRSYQRKQAILMDQINVLTVEKERLEVSFLNTQFRNSSRIEQSDGDFSWTSSIFNTPRKIDPFLIQDELILDDEEPSKDHSQNSDHAEKESASSSTMFSDNTHAEENQSTTDQASSVIEEAVNTTEQGPLSSSSAVQTKLPVTLNVTEEIKPKKMFKDAGTQNDDADWNIEEQSSQRSPPKEKRRCLPATSTKKTASKNSRIRRLQKSLSSNMSNNSENIPQPSQDIQIETNSDGSIGSKEKIRKKRYLSKRNGHSRIRGGSTCSPPPPQCMSPQSTIIDSEDEKRNDERKNYRKSTIIPSRNIYEVTTSEDELFFVCSSSAIIPPTMSARNVKIYAPSSREPLCIVEHDNSSSYWMKNTDPIRSTESSTVRQSIELGSPIVNGSEYMQNDFATPPSSNSLNCSINLNLQNYSNHSISLAQEPIRIEDNGEISFATRPSISSSDEEEPSVWYEYGCV